MKVRIIKQYCRTDFCWNKVSTFNIRKTWGKGREDRKIYGCSGLSLIKYYILILCFIFKKHIKWERDVEVVYVYMFHLRNRSPDFNRMFFFSDYGLNLLAKLILILIFPMYMCIYVHAYIYRI
jgi:hypothetical protein